MSNSKGPIVLWSLLSIWWMVVGPYFANDKFPSVWWIGSAVVCALLAIAWRPTK